MTKYLLSVGAKLSLIPSTDVLLNTYAMQGMGIGNLVVIYMDMVSALLELQSLWKDNEQIQRHQVL